MSWSSTGQRRQQRMMKRRRNGSGRRTEHSQVSSGIPATVLNENVDLSMGNPEPLEPQAGTHQVASTGLQPVPGQPYHTRSPEEPCFSPLYYSWPSYSLSELDDTFRYEQSPHPSISYQQDVGSASSYQHLAEPTSSYQHAVEPASSYPAPLITITSYPELFSPHLRYRFPPHLMPGDPDPMLFDPAFMPIELNDPEPSVAYRPYTNQYRYPSRQPNLSPQAQWITDVEDKDQDDSEKVDSFDLDDLPLNAELTPNLEHYPYLSSLDPDPDPDPDSHPHQYSRPLYSYQSRSDPGLYDGIDAKTSEGLSDVRSRHGSGTTPNVNISGMNFGDTNDSSRINSGNTTSPALEDEGGADSANASAVSDEELGISPSTYHTPHLMPLQNLQYHRLLHDWKTIQASLPADWQWDVEYHTTKANHSGQHGSWTCTPLDLLEQKCYPLTIAGAPVIIPVEYRWPPESGLTPPPDPRATTPIDCWATLPLELVKDLFLTFKDSIGFYVLINGLLQVIVPEYYDTSWASSHLPHKYGGLKVCYIEQNLEPTMLPSATDTSRVTTSGSPVGSHDVSGIFRPASLSTQSVIKFPSLKLNDLIEARAVSNHRRERFSGRVGLRVTRAGLEPLIVMSTHVITEAILAKSHRDTIFSRGLDDRFKKLEDDWNEHVNIWAGEKKIGTIDKTFDKEAKLYPAGFKHDITLIKPSPPAVVQDIVSPVANLGWLHQKSWNSLRQQTSTVKILADAESSRLGKSIKCSRPSDVLVVGEGIFLNQKAAAGSSKSLKDHDASTWNDLVSRALLYRVYPDFDPPNGHSGTALYAEGAREDGTEGPGIVGFQSFVQRSGHVQNFEMEGPALERRLQLGRVAFYGAFEVPSELKQYDIV
ncbi:unnamed protein product [Alternaria burnsii]|nr:unnamed protein product [Alternaria burnsii]